MMVPIVNTPTTIPQTFLRPCGILRFHHQSDDNDDDDDDDTDDLSLNVVAVFDGTVVVANDASVRNGNITPFFIFFNFGTNEKVPTTTTTASVRPQQQPLQ
jgi:hypothetical protein